MLKTSGNTGQYVNKKFVNNVYLIHDFYLQFDNIATENDLGLFSNKTKLDFKTRANESYQLPTVISDDGQLYEQFDYQYIWLINNTNINGVNTPLYDGAPNSGTTILKTEYLNIGPGLFLNGTFKLLNDETNIWYDGVSENIGATIHPYVESTNITNKLVDNNNQGLHILESQKSEKLPIHIYFKPDLSTINGSIWLCNTLEEPKSIKKALKLYIEEENGNRPFEFTIIFKLNRHNRYALQSEYISNGSYTNNSNSTN
jgi:hypothetical protein